MRIYESILMFFKTFNLKSYNVTYRLQRKSLYADRLLAMFSEMTYIIFGDAVLLIYLNYIDFLIFNNFNF